MADDVNLGPVRVARKRSDLIARKYFLSQAAIDRLDQLAEAYGDSYSVVLEYLILGAQAPAGCSENPTPPATGSAPAGGSHAAPAGLAGGAPEASPAGAPTDNDFDLED